MIDLIDIQNTNLRAMQDAEDLAEYIRRVRERDLGISLEAVEQRARNKGYKISRGYISQIENRYIVSPTAAKLQALAAGLGVPEEEIFAVARGKPMDKPQIPAEFGVLFYGWDEATDEQKAETLAAIRMIAESFQRRRERNPPKPKGNNGAGKKKK